MAALWSAIKGTSDHQHDGLLQQSAANGTSGTVRPPSASRILSGASSQHSPRSPSSVEPRGASPASATPAPGKKTPSSRLSRSNTASAWKEKDRDRDDSDVQNAEDAVRGPNIARATPPPTVQPPIGSAIDPLSQHIFQRTNSDHPIPRRRLPSRPDSPAPAIEGLLSQPNVDQGAKAIAPAGDGTKDKSKKGPSFLSRLGMRGIKKKDAGEIDSESEIGSEARMDGINALVFSQSLASPFGGAGYTPRHKEPPRYIRTKANNKPAKEFNRMFLAQELVGTNPPKLAGGEEPGTDASRPPDVTVSVAGADGRKVTRTGGAIWATEFSKDGKYLATAGRDHVVRIWAVISTPEERRACEEEEAANGATGERLSAPVFRGRPVRELDGHTGEILDLSWSKNNFLLSSSMDKTVRLWHISRSDCLCTFKHKDFVTRLAFHPQDDRFFLAGSLDTMLRLWSIPDKAIAYSEQLPDLVTAVAFSPDGRTAIAGLLNGLCLFYETDGLKFQNQIHVRSSRGKNAKGSKITSIQTISIPPPNPLDHSQTMSGSVSQASADLSSQAEVAVLITSNDSRIRIYSLREKVLDIKLKGHENVCSQIGATFSDDGKYVICGSEDRKAFIWSLVGSAGSSKSEGKPAYEYFDAHGTMVTTALFAPTRTRMLLGQSGDPLYDLCNPPPVVLRSLEETTSAVASQTGLSADELHHSVSPEASKKPEPSAAYIARSTHYDGNIIVTTDDTGIIKVFRQDCAYTKRRSDNWETGSTLSRKLTAHGTFKSSGMARSGSILTRTSASSAAHSRRGSLSQSVASSAMASPKFPPGPSNSDRILSWRQSIEHGSDRRSSAIAHDGMTPTRTERSTSPTKANRNVLGSSAANLASDARKQPYGNSSPAGPRVGSTVASPTASMFSNTPERMPARIVTGKTQPAEDAASPPIPTPSFTFRPADQDEQSSPTGSGSFWNLSRWRGKAGSKSGTGQGQVSGHTRAPSSGSLLSRSPMTMEHLGDGAEKEPETKGAKEKGKDKRRQSLGFFGSVEPSDSSRRKSLPSPSIGQAASDSDIRSIPTINVPLGEEEIHPESNPVRLKRDVSPYRHLWSRDSRQSSELSGDIEEEEESAEETVCRQCGGREFKVRKVAGKQRLSCGRCGMLVD